MSDDIFVFPQDVPAVDGGNGHKRAGGMTLRDYFAAQALQAVLILTGESGSVRVIASTSYSLADAMIAERDKWQH